MVDFNLSLKQFEDISNGTHNVGLVDVKSDGQNKFKLTKIDHHVTLTSLNNKSLDPQKIVKIKESFINALEKEHLPQESINEIRKSLGLDISMSNSMEENRAMINRRYIPLTRQQIKEYIAKAKGLVVGENRDLEIQNRVLDGLPKNTKVRTKALLSLSYLSGVRLSEMQNLQENDLKFFAKQPKILNQVYKNVRALVDAFSQDPNHNNKSLSSYLFKRGNREDIFTLKIVKGENNQPYITGSVKIDNDTIPLNFMVSPNEYLDTINQRLLDFLDVLPDVKAENDVSLGRTYLLQNLEALKAELSEDQLNGTQQNHLRSLSLAILKKDNDEINPNVERLSTDALLGLAKSQLQYDNIPENLNKMINSVIKNVMDFAENLEPGNLVQNQPVIVQDQQQNIENNEPLNNVQNEEVVVDNLYEAPVYEDSKNITLFTNQLFDVIGQSLQADDNQNIDFNTVKNLFANNTDVMLSFIMDKTKLGNYEDEVNGNKTVISPKFNALQLTSVFNQIIEDYKEVTGKNFAIQQPTKAQVDGLKLFLRNNATVQNLDKTISKSMNYVATQFIRGQLPLNDVEQVQGQDQARPFPDLSFKSYSKVSAVNKFLIGLAKLARGNDLNAFKAFIWNNHETFLTFISGQFDGNEKIDTVHREQFRQIGSELRAKLKNLTGIDGFENNPDFSKFTAFEFNKLLVRLNDDQFIRDLKSECEKVPLSISSFKDLIKDEIDDVKQNSSQNKSSKEEPVKSYIEPMQEFGVRRLKSKDELIGREDGKFANTVLPTAGDIIPSPGAKWVRAAMKNEPGRLVTDIKIQALPVNSFIKAEDSGIRKVAGFFLSVKHAGDKNEQIRKLVDFLKTDLDSLVLAVSDKDYLKKCLPPKMQPLTDDLYSLIKDSFQAVADMMVEDKKYTKSFNVTNLSYGEFNLISDYISSIRNYNSFREYSKGIEKPELYEKIFDAIDKNLENSSLLEKAGKSFQEFINEVFKLDDNFKLENTYLNMTAQEIKDSLAKKSVDEILNEASLDKTKSAKVAFNLLVLKNYFSQISKTEIAQILDNALQTEPNDPDKGEFAIAENKRFLSAIFKGAGPLLQKMLQGMNKDLADKTYGDVFDELKSNLKHIDPTYIEHTIKKYKATGRRTTVNVAVGQPLGSATVAETYKCHISVTTRGEWGTSKKEDDVVIKVMRPNVKQRAENEAKIFSDAAKQIPGMSESWGVQYDSIMKEFDFENEAKNIDECHDLFEVKNNKESPDIHVAPDVHCLEREKMIPVQNDIVMTNEIKGDTVDKTYNALEAEINTEFRKIFKVNSESGGWQLDKNGKPVIRDDVSITDIMVVRRDIASRLKTLFKYNGLINQATAKWIKEAIFNSGTIHNDIHGGNLMISDRDESITFIDFGNVVKISKEIQIKFKDLLVYTMHRDTQKFMDTLLPMLPKQPSAEQREKMNVIVDVIMQKGHSTKDAGYRFTAIIAELKKLGVVFPSEIDGISNGLNRLQSFAENTSKLLKSTKGLYECIIGNAALSPYQQSEEEQKFSFEGNMFNEIIDKSLGKEIPDESYFDTLIAHFKDPKDELRTTLTQKILIDGFDGNLSYSEKFFEKYVNKSYVNKDELKKKDFQKHFDNYKLKMSEAKAKGLTFQQISGIINDQKSPIPNELEPHSDLIRELRAAYNEFDNLVYYALTSRLLIARSWCIDAKRYERIEPSVDQNGKILNDPYESNNISVEGVLGKMITEANNFTMTRINQPLEIDIANNAGSALKPLVEVSENPLGHGSVQGKIAG